MKKIISILFVLMMVVSVVGCTPEAAPSQPEEETGAAITPETEPQEHVTGPNNMAILNYDGDGLERLTQIEVNCNDNPYDHEFEIGATDKIAIFGEVSNVAIGYAQWYTEGNYMPIKEFDHIKDTELVIHRSAMPEEMFIVSFYDAGMRYHTYHLMTDEYFVSEDPDEQELVAELAKKDQLPSSYTAADDFIELLVSYMGMTEEEFKSNNNFAHVETEYGEMEGEPYFHLNNELLGYDITLYCDPWGEWVIDSITIIPNDGYNDLKDGEKKSFLGVDFDMSIYGARYNLNNTRDDMEVSLGEKYDDATDDYCDQLGSIYIEKKE